MNTTISDAAVSAACMVVYSNYVGGKRDYRQQCDVEMRDALEAALPHLQPAKPEAVRLRDELREQNPNVGVIDRARDAYQKDHYMHGALDHAAAELSVLHARDQRSALAATGKQHPTRGFTDTEIDSRLDVLHRNMVASGQHKGGMVGVAWNRAVYRVAARQSVGQEPIVVEAVATIQRDGDGELYVDWLTEGGIHDLPVGDVLMGSSVKLTNDEGYGEVYVAAPPAQAVDLGQQQDAARWRAIEPLLSVEWDEDEKLKRWTWIDFKGDAPAIPSATRQEYASVDEAVDALISQHDAAPRVK